MFNSISEQKAEFMKKLDEIKSTKALDVTELKLRVEKLQQKAEYEFLYNAANRRIKDLEIEIEQQSQYFTKETNARIEKAQDS
jgi:hypothetical protein